MSRLTYEQACIIAAHMHIMEEDPDMPHSKLLHIQPVELTADSFKIVALKQQD